MSNGHPLWQGRTALFAAASAIAMIATIPSIAVADSEVGSKSVSWEDIVADEKTPGDVVSWAWAYAITATARSSSLMPAMSAS